MTREEKNILIDELKVKFENHQYFYITDASGLTVEQVNKLRGLLYTKGIEMKVVKNTLAKKALEQADSELYTGLYESLVGPTAILFSEASNAPAKAIKEFRASSEKPILKAAYIDSDVYVGDHMIDVLATLKSKEELVAEVIALLQSPAKNVISALNSGKTTIGGLIKTLQDRAAS